MSNQIKNIIRDTLKEGLFDFFKKKPKYFFNVLDKKKFKHGNDIFVIYSCGMDRVWRKEEQRTVVKLYFVVPEYINDIKKNTPLEPNKFLGFHYFFPYIKIIVPHRAPIYEMAIVLKHMKELSNKFSMLLEYNKKVVIDSTNFSSMFDNYKKQFNNMYLDIEEIRKNFEDAIENIQKDISKLKY